MTPPRRILAGTVTAAAVPFIALGIAAPASAMHDSPAPVGEMAPVYSGHYSVPDIGQKGVARPWAAGPAWNR